MGSISIAIAQRAPLRIPAHARRVQMGISVLEARRLNAKPPVLMERS